MKRSEMVDIIALELEDINQENYFDEKGSKWCGNLILMKMEEMGMLAPPMNLNYVEKNYTKDIHSEFELCFWEPENE